MGTSQRFEVVAHNTATASSNKIHDDEVARRYGFGGGLVPGVDVYAYMTRPAVAAWGVDWLSGGTMHARFLSPVYEGQVVVVTASEPTPATTTATATDESGPSMSIEVAPDLSSPSTTARSGSRTVAKPPGTHRSRTVSLARFWGPATRSSATACRDRRVGSRSVTGPR